MRLLKASVLCGLMLLLVSAVAVSSASASEPALWQCGTAKKVNKKYTGKFTDKKCSKEATTKEKEEGKTNKYEFEEWNAGSPTEKTGKSGKVKAFEDKKGGPAELEVPLVGGVTCEHSTDSGKFDGPKEGHEVHVTFTGCESDSAKCENTATAGEIKTNTLAGSVGYALQLNPKTEEYEKVVAIDLHAETGTVNATFHCEYIHFEVSGSVEGRVEPPFNKWTKEATLDFESDAGVQLIQNLEGEAKDTLITAYCDGAECTPHGEIESGEDTRVTNKGEELYFKATL